LVPGTDGESPACTIENINCEIKIIRKNLFERLVSWNILKTSFCTSLINSANTLMVELNAFAFYYQLFLNTAASGKYAIIAKSARATPVQFLKY